MQTVRLILATGEVLEVPSATLAHQAARRVIKARGWDPERMVYGLELDHELMDDEDVVAGHDGALATVWWRER